MNADVLIAIRQSDAIPSMPQIVTRLLEVTSDANYKQDEVVELLATDAGVTTDILRLANSALFGLTRQVSSLRQALTILGIRRTRTLVMGRCMIERANAGPPHALDVGFYWRRSLATGVLAARFADDVLSERREEAFIAGLLCDIGVMVLSRALGTKYAPLAKAYSSAQTRDLLAQELKLLGVGHPEVSALVLERWMLPEEMVAAIRHHHNSPFDALPARVGHLAAIICGASDIARLLCHAPDKSTIAPTCTSAMALVGLPIATLGSVLQQVEADVRELASALRIDVVPSQSYELIATTIAQELSVAAP
ncbi:MAG: HDOD domain-containing protein [Phycisphaerae bacterium]